jgi:hypothetical protein
MSILWSGIAYEGGISGSGTVVYTGPELYKVLAQGEKFFVEVRVSQSSSTSGTPQLKVDIEHSIEAVNSASWSVKSTPIAATNAPTGAITYLRGSDTGGTPGASSHRLALTLTGTGPALYVQVFVTVRTND